VANPDRQTFCLACGKPLQEARVAARPPGSVVCPNCTGDSVPGDRFCRRCGEVLFCVGCGTLRREESRFCRGCGLDLGALRSAPEPEGQLGTISMIGVDRHFDAAGSPSELLAQLEEWPHRGEVDPVRLDCVDGFLRTVLRDASSHPGKVEADFRSYRQVASETIDRRQVMGSFKLGPVSLIRHPWLDAKVTLFDGTELHLIIVTTVRREKRELKARPGDRLQVDQLTDLVLFTLQLQENRELRPGDQERLTRELTGDDGRLRRVSVHPHAATFEFAFGPAHIFESGRADTMSGYDVHKRLWHKPLEQVIHRAYKRTLDAGDEGGFY
jgi:hypothetical protein